MNFSGHLSLRGERQSNGRTVLGHQSFRAPFHLSKPYWDDRALLVQVVNPTAGILAGDRLESHVQVDSGAAVLLTTPSATRLFHMRDGAAESVQRLHVHPEAWLEYWPEPLVPHQGSVFTQRTEIDVAVGGELFFADFLMPGRVARGELWMWQKLVLELRLRTGGQLVLKERLDQSGSELRAMAALAGMEHAAAFGTIVVVSPRLCGSEHWRSAIAALHGSEAWIGISRLRGEAMAYCIKLIAPDGDALRRCHRRIRELTTPLLPRLASDPRKI